uniref:Uncharacterized protein n=1 Tax=Anguilla anguilla TaxID=7936 RepID=A0A0E9S6W6_ANGAN
MLHYIMHCFVDRLYQIFCIIFSVFVGVKM